VTDERLLFERGGRGKLVTRRSGRPLGEIRLTRGRPGAAAAQAGAVRRGRRGTSPATLTVTRTSRGRARLTLDLRRIAVRSSHGCQRLPASMSKALQPFRLETAIRLSNGRSTRAVPLHAQWRCTRSRGGAVTGMRTVAPARLAQHPGLTVSITGPRRVIPGDVATYEVRVRNNRRKAQSRYVSSLWHILVQARPIPGAAGETVDTRTRDPRPRRIGELRQGKTKVLRIPVRIPRELQADRVCVGAVAVADSARPDRARACAAVAAPGACAGGSRARSASRCARWTAWSRPPR
jgi:hypothetical protein